MKLTILITFLTNTLSFGFANGQTNNKFVGTTQQNKTRDHFEYTFKSAHLNARTLMKEEFYWSPIEETAPFGSDDGSDAAYGFRQWRVVKTTVSPVSYLNHLIESWHYPYFDYNEMDTSKIKAYINQKANLDEVTIQQQIQTLKEINKNSPDTLHKLDDNQLREVVISASNGMGGMYLLGQDNAIIGTGFAQFVLEGHIDEDIRTLTITAIKRQLLPLLINRYDGNYHNKRKQQLTKMLNVVNKANS